MKYWKRISGFLLAFCLIFLQISPVLASGGTNGYTYKVRLFSGAQGTIDGKEVVVKKNLQYGDRVSFSQRQVELKDNSKYYIKGFRESGKDNNTAVSTASFPVTGDMDYVVVYGLLGNAVAYTVNYVDTNGNSLAPSETYYGNVGDEPVLAYLYIEGYQPQAYNLTGTLKENAADNVFNFVYTSEYVLLLQCVRRFRQQREPHSRQLREMPVLMRKPGKKAGTPKMKQPQKKAEMKAQRRKVKEKMPGLKSWSVLTMKKHLWPTRT